MGEGKFPHLMCWLVGHRFTLLRTLMIKHPTRPDGTSWADTRPEGRYPDKAVDIHVCTRCLEHRTVRLQRPGYHSN